MPGQSKAVRSHVAPNGTIEVYFASPNVMVFKWTGAHSGDSADFLVKTVESVIGLGIKPTFYIDLEDMTNIDNAFRSRAVESISKMRKNLGAFNFFIKSKILGMAVSVINLGMGGNLVKKVFSTRDEFETTLRAEAGQTTAIDWPVAGTPPRSAQS